MRNCLCALAIASLLLALPCPEAAAGAYEGIAYYYLKPNPQAVPDLMGEMDSVAEPMRDTADWPMGMFLAEVFAKNPEVAQELKKRRGAHSPRGRYTIALAACQAQLPDYKDFVRYMLPEDSLAEIRDEMLRSKFRPLAEIPVYNATVLDALWGGFMASGNRAYVENIIKALGNAVNEDVVTEIALVQGAAHWSLRSNAVQHPLVLEICRELRDAGTLPAASHEALLEVIRAAEEALATGR